MFYLRFASQGVLMITCASRLEIENVGNVTIVTFLDKKIEWEGLGENIDLIGDQLFRLIDSVTSNILLDFRRVDYCDCSMLGKLVSLQRMVTRINGRMMMCNIKEDIFEKLDETRLSSFFGLKRGLDRAGALNEFL